MWTHKKCFKKFLFGLIFLLHVLWPNNVWIFPNSFFSFTFYMGLRAKLGSYLLFNNAALDKLSFPVCFNCVVVYSFQVIYSDDGCPLRWCFTDILFHFLLGNSEIIFQWSKRWKLQKLIDYFEGEIVWVTLTKVIYIVFLGYR